MWNLGGGTSGREAREEVERVEQRPIEDGELVELAGLVEVERHPRAVPPALDRARRASRRITGIDGVIPFRAA